MARNYAVPTGEFVAEWLEENSLKPAELARRTGVSRKHISELISGKATLSYDMAERLELATKVSARIWMNYETLYRSDAARLRKDEHLADRYSDIAKFPLDYLRKRELITADPQERGEVARQLLSFFGVGDVDTLLAQPDRVLAAFRQSGAYTIDKFAVATWIQVGTAAAETAELPQFDAHSLRSLLPELRALTVKSVEEFGRKMVDLPRQAGVLVVLDAGPTGTRCSGVTHWVKHRPVVQLTDRGKQNDQVWFSFFHELGHVLLHPHNEVFVECSDAKSDRENEADKFSRDLLIPPDDWERRPRGRNVAAVAAYAAEIGIHPGIVIGRIHRETQNFGWGHQLKQKVKLVDD